MINRTITSYTLLHYFSEKGLSQLDLYVPFACKSINKNASKTVSVDDIKKWFSVEYGLSKVYQGVFVSLLKRMNSLGILSLEKGCYYINHDRLTNEIEKYHENDNSASVVELSQQLINYSKETFGIDYSIEEAQEGILRFLDNHDGDIILDTDSFANRTVKSKKNKINIKKINYII